MREFKDTTHQDTLAPADHSEEQLTYEQHQIDFAVGIKYNNPFGPPLSSPLSSYVYFQVENFELFETKSGLPDT